MGAYRTGRRARAAKALRPKSPVIVAIIGTGYQAHTQVLALSRVCEIQELRAYGRIHTGERPLFRTVRRALGLHVVASESAEAAVRGADIVVVMTTSSQPVLEADWVAPHALVIAAGSKLSESRGDPCRAGGSSPLGRRRPAGHRPPREWRSHPGSRGR